MTPELENQDREQAKQQALQLYNEEFELDHPRPQSGLLRKIWWETRRILNLVPIIRLKWILASMVIFVGFVVVTQYQFSNQAADQRTADRIEQEKQRASDKFVDDLATYNLAVSARDLCVEGVARSDKNRLQHELLSDKFEALGMQFNSQVIIQLAEDLRKGPLLADEPRTVEECPTVPARPVAPSVEAEQRGDRLPSVTPPETVESES